MKLNFETGLFLLENNKIGYAGLKFQDTFDIVIEDEVLIYDYNGKCTNKSKIGYNIKEELTPEKYPEHFI